MEEEEIEEAVEKETGEEASLGAGVRPLAVEEEIEGEAELKA